MSAEQVHHLFANERQDMAAGTGEGTLIPITHRAEQQAARQEQALFDGFRGYSQQRFDADPTTMQPEEAPRVAQAAHHFLAATILGRINALNPSAEGAEPHKVAQTPEGFIYAIPSDPIDQRIRAYYARFGTHRRSKSPELLAPEIQFLEAMKRPLYAHHYEDQYDADTETSTTVKRPRAAVFPEIGLGFRLHEILQRRNHVLAADSVETVLATYGERFLILVGQRAIIRENDDAYDYVPVSRQGGIVREFHIPNDPQVQAEELRPHKPYKSDK